MRSEPVDVHADLTVVSDGEPSAISASEPNSPSEPSSVDDVAVPVGPVLSRRPYGRITRWVSEVPLALVIVGVGIGLVTIALHHFRWGSLVISMSVLAAGVFRLVLPARQAGLLVVRGRFTDVVTMAFIGGALFVLAAVTST